jgi:hypothetical protein
MPPTVKDKTRRTSSRNKKYNPFISFEEHDVTVIKSSQKFSNSKRLNTYLIDVPLKKSSSRNAESKILCQITVLIFFFIPS